MASANTGYALAGEKIYKTTNGGTTAVSNPEADVAITVFPNPAKSEIRLSHSSNLEIQSIDLVDMTGKLLKSFPINSSKIDVSFLPAGIYFLKITSNLGVLMKKIAID